MTKKLNELYLQKSTLLNQIETNPCFVSSKTKRTQLYLLGCVEMEISKEKKQHLTENHKTFVNEN